MVGAFAFSFPAVKGSADGNLKLNTDVLVNNGTSIGGSGEFSIRGQLFSSELEEQSQKLKRVKRNSQNKYKQYSLMIRARKALI
jgi:hypothetical protein